MFPLDLTRRLTSHVTSKDTLKISGMQVSPAEIEDVLLAQPDKYIIDVSVVGVPGGRTSDELVPRAWVVLSPKGMTIAPCQVVAALEAWTQHNLSKYKWLRGGIEVVVEVSPRASLFLSPRVRVGFLTA
jgi:acyl-CoA synthetase (AMP-forming)/AMP-acid ligase II